MAILYRSNPMPTGGALFVTNPKKPSVRVNRNQFAKFIAGEEGEPSKWRQYNSKKFMRTKAYGDLRRKHLKKYMAKKNRTQRITQQRISRATAKAAFSGEGKTEAKANAVKELRKKPLNLTKAEASQIFEKYYQPPKTIKRKRNTSSSKTTTVSRGNPMTKTARRAAAAKRAKSLIRSKRLISFAKFRGLYKGCGHSVKAVSRMYKKYKKEVLQGKAGYAPGLGRLTKKRKATKKRKSTTKRRSSSKKRTSKSRKSSKKLSAYQRFVKSQAGKGLSMKQIAAKWRSKGHTHKHKKSAKKKHSHKHSHRKTTKSHAHKHKKAAKRGSSFGQLGITLRRLGYTRPLSSKTLDTVTKRRAKIKALRAKGATMKKYEGVKRAKSRSASKRKGSGKTSLYSYWLRESKAMRGGSRSGWAHGYAKNDYKKYKSEMEGLMKKGKTKLQAVRAVLKKHKGYSVADKRYKKHSQARRSGKRTAGFFLANPSEILKSGLFQPVIGLMDLTEGVIGNIPIVGNSVAPFTKPILLGAGMGALSYYAMKKFGPELEKVPYAGKILEKGAYTVGGGALALICMIGSKMGILNPENASLVASAAVLTGAAIDVHDHLLGSSSYPVVIPESYSERGIAVQQISQQEDEEAEVIVEQMQQQGQQGQQGQQSDEGLGAIHLGAINLGAVHLGALNLGAVHLGHAAHAPADFSVKEGQALVNGPQAFAQVAGKPGAEGKRWGWLIKMVGFDNAQELAKLPPKKRLLIIQKLKRNAQVYASGLLAHSHSAPAPSFAPPQLPLNNGLEDASLPIAGAANCPGGVEGLGYGALMLAGSGY